MSKSEKLMIFGAGVLQLSLIKTAKTLGYYTVVVDPDRYAVGKNIADEFIVLAGNDYDQTLEIAETNQIKGIVTAATDKPLLLMAKIAEKLQLPFPSEEAIYNTINKFELKRVLLKNNIPCAKGILSDLTALTDNLSHTEIDFPVIVKPVDSSGSRGVYYCKNIDELKIVFAESIKYSNIDKVLIEEYLEGPEISIEAIVQDNSLYIIQITDKTVTPFPYNVEMGHLQPSRFFTEFYNEIYEVLLKAVKALRLNNCALHPEMKITKDGIKIVEIGPRLGGDYITSHLTPLSTGINMEEQLVKLAVGDKIHVIQSTSRFSSILYFDFFKKQIDRSRIKDKIELIKDQISDFEIYYDQSAILPVITNSLERHGHVIFSADNLEDLALIKEKIINS